jgi:ketopantoate reductase
MRILVYGAGVVGSFYAVQLHEAGHEVTLLARGQRLADIREYGVVLEDIDTGQQTATSVRVAEQLAPEDAYDLALVAMRKNQVQSVLPALAANQHTPSVLFLGNNAAGPDELATALGRERVLLGFGGVGGVRADHVVRYVAGKGRRRAAVLAGELDGRSTPRLQQIVGAFAQAGVQVEVCPRIDAWLKSHIAFVGPLANALCGAGGDNYRLARTRDGVVLAIRGIHEGFRVLRALGVPVIPLRLRLFMTIPEPILVPQAQRMLATPAAEIGLAGHAQAARDEMLHLAEEFKALIRASGVSTPAMDRLYTYLDPAVPPIPDSSATIALRWLG